MLFAFTYCMSISIFYSNLIHCKALHHQRIYCSRNSKGNHSIQNAKTTLKSLCSYLWTFNNNIFMCNCDKTNALHASKFITKLLCTSVNPYIESCTLQRILHILIKGAIIFYSILRVKNEFHSELLIIVSYYIICDK